MWEKAVWLGVPEEEIKRCNIAQGDMNGRFTYYRLVCEIREEASLEVVITANSRYRLWINNQPVLSGPCKGDRYRQYHDTVDLSEYLVIGKNVFAVQVLLCDPNAVVHQFEERAPLVAVCTQPIGHGLAMEGDIKNKSGEIIETVTTGEAMWKVSLERDFYLTSNQITMNLGAICEAIDFRKSISNWKTIKFQDTSWTVPRILEPVQQNEIFKRFGFVGNYVFEQRPIPLLYEKSRNFVGECGKEMFGDEQSITIKQNQTWVIILDAGEILNAYIAFPYEGGKDAVLKITYAEKFTKEQEDLKRTDYINGEITGITDTLTLNGDTAVYEPFWFRTFRFINSNFAHRL